MKTYLSKVFYFLGDLVSYLLHYNITGIIFYPLYRRLMLISVKLDSNNVVWGNEVDRQNKKRDFIVKLKRLQT